MEHSDTAHHEAAHAVVLYRLTGSAGGAVTIVPTEATLGAAHDGTSDSMNLEHLEATVLSLYAGGHAQRRIDPANGADGCDNDDEQADEWLSRCGWSDRESEFRQRSGDLVNQHWAEITAVAAELLAAQTLDMTEVEILADIAIGDAPADGLATYRALRRG